VTFQGGGLTLLRTDQPPGIAARGELGAIQAGALVSAVDRVADETGGDVVLDCTALEFLGVGGLCGILSAANVLWQQGHRLRVRGLSPHYARDLAAGRAGQEPWASAGMLSTSVDVRTRELSATHAGGAS